MGATRLRFDGAGYNRAVEEGVDLPLTGEELFEKYATDGNAVFPGGFFSPRGSGYLMSQPRQFSSRWYADSRLSDHVLYGSLWTWAAGLNVLEFFPPHKIGSATYPKDRWFSFYVPTGTPALASVNFAGMNTAGGIALPSTTRLIGICNQTPPSVGLPLGDPAYSHFMPFLQFLHYPSPDNAVVFGWSNLAVALFGDNGYLFRSPTNDRQTWQLLAHWHGSDYRSMIQIPVDPYAEVEAMERAKVRSLLALEVGDSHLYLYPGGEPVAVKLRDSPGIGNATEYLPAGAWWLAVPTDQKVIGQVQVVGGEVAVTPSSHPEVFNLGAGHGPTLAPTVGPAYVMHLSTPGNVTTTLGPGGTTIASNDTGEQIQYELENAENGIPWVSNGVIYRGALFLSLLPSTPAGKPGGYLLPQIKLFEITFPTLLTPRDSAELILSDTQFDDWEIEASYHDSENAKLTITLREEEVLWLESEGIDERDNFPIEIEENIALFGPANWVKRAAFWVQKLELEELKVEGADPGLRRYRVTAKGLLSRAETRWRLSPTIIDPATPGFVEQSYAVRKTLEQARFDVSDPAKVQIYPDPDAGTDRARLPATWGKGTGKPGAQVKNAHGPNWDETKLGYCKRVATQWAGWVLYTLLDGTIWYHPDLPTRLSTLEEFYYPSVTLHKNAAAAVAAGVNSRQVYRMTTKETISPVANAWAIHGVDDEYKPAAFEERDLGSITNILDPDFVGEEIPHVTVLKFGVGTAAGAVLARIGLRRTKRRKIIRKFETELPPWYLEGPLDFDVGSAFTAEARGDFICIHLRVKLIHRDVYSTTITGERVPANALLGGDAGVFPGQGVEG